MVMALWNCPNCNEEFVIGGEPHICKTESVDSNKECKDFISCEECTIQCEVESDNVEDTFDDDNPQCPVCGNYYCPCCGCDCFMDDREEEKC